MLNVLNNLSIIVKNSKLYSEHQLKNYSLAFSEQIILMYLSIHKESNQEALVKHFQVDKGSIAKTIIKLNKKGYLTKHRNPENERENLLTLTSKGEEIITQMNDILSSWLTILYHEISEEDIIVLDHLIKKMMENTTQYHEL